MNEAEQLARELGAQQTAVRPVAAAQRQGDE